MRESNNQSKGRQAFAAQRTPNPLRAGLVVPATPRHEEIARYAYKIYVETGCREGQSEQNWLQAERALKNKQNWLEFFRQF